MYVALASCSPACMRGGLAEVPAEADHLHALVALGQFLQALLRAVGRAVIDEHDFPRPSEPRQHGQKLLVQQRDVFELVIDGDDNRDAHP